MISPSASRRAAAVALLALVGVLTAACGPKTAGADPSSTAEGVGSLDTVAPTTQPAPPPTDISPTYPDDAQAYAQAVLDAWAGNSPSWLQALTAAGVAEEIFDLNASPFDDWAFLRCDGAAGSSYCSFVNSDDGDVITLRIGNQLLGQAHAAQDVILDKTVYPNDGVAYVKEFVGAWQFGNEVRMLLLSTPAVVDEVGTGAPVNPNYPAPTCCGGGLLQVKVNWSGKFATFDVGTIKLGGPNAILAYEVELGLTL